jgi:hypothetical protein
MKVETRSEEETWCKRDRDRLDTLIQIRLTY